MKELSRLAKNVNPSTTLAIDAMAKQMRADGLDVIGFGAGEPDFETPVNIQDVGVDAIRKGKTKYTPAAGIAELRRAAAARLKADCGLDYDWTQIVVASGAKHNVYVALAALLNPGDEVIVPAPYWVSYCEMVSMLGGVPVPVLAEEAQHFKITPAQLEAAVTAKTKAVMLNNPSNPTGMFYTKPELEALAEVCLRHDLYAVSYTHLDVYKRQALRRAGKARAQTRHLRRRRRGRHPTGPRAGLRYLPHCRRQAPPVHLGQRGGHKPHRRRALSDGKRRGAGALPLAGRGFPRAGRACIFPRAAGALLPVKT